MRIEISTPVGRVFDGDASSFEFRTDTGMCVEIRPNEVQYLSFIRDGEISLVIDHQHIAFSVHNASAGFSKGLLTILAATVLRTVQESQKAE